MTTHSIISRRARILRGRARRVRSCSHLQRRRRNAFRAALNAKRLAWSQGHWGLWDIYAQNHPLTNRANKTYVPTADTWFMKINTIRCFNNLSPLMEPPPY